MKKLVFLLIAVCISPFALAQSETELIKATLNDYIEGTANGEPDRIKRAFHEELNLYTVNPDGSLRIRNGLDYISLFKEGQKNNRVGRILAIDYENNAASAKVEIKMGNRTFIDYFLLLKLNDEWKVIHKSYTIKTD